MKWRDSLREGGVVPFGPFLAMGGFALMGMGHGKPFQLFAL
jgi:leader peptidase (prepilin peptidase)/N-methyltransferase